MDYIEYIRRKYPDILDKNINQRSIVAIGCSMTYGIYKKSYPDFLQEYFKDLKVVNLGIKGSNIPLCISVAKEYISNQSIKYCIFQIPSFWRLPVGRFEKFTEYGLWAPFYFFHSCSKREDVLNYLESIFDNEIKRILSFVDEFNEYSDKFIFLLYDYNCGRFSYYKKFSDISAKFYNKIREELLKRNIKCSPIIKQNDFDSFNMLGEDNIHPNENGNQYLASVVLPIMQHQEIKQMKSDEKIIFQRKSLIVPDERYPLW